MRGLLLVLLLGGCGSRTGIVLQYQLVGIDLAELVRVETLVSVDPADGRHFFADSPYRSVAPGVGIEIRDFNGTGDRQVLVSQDATLGYQFAGAFSFTLLPPAGEAPPPLLFRARAVAAVMQIGATQPLPGKFAPNAALAVMLTDQRCAGVSCAADQACCNDLCDPIASDPQNCGGCGMSCGASGDSCSGSACRCVGGSGCAAGSTCCPGRGCVDFMSDAFNCGACGHACNPGESCNQGVCACGTSKACAAGVLCCSDGSCAAGGSCPCGATQCNAPSQCCDQAAGLCANLGTDSNNCGACGTVCSAPLTCVQGACACNGVVCASGDACCSAGCRNLQDDPQNCGTCGHDCGPGSACVAGTCMCGSTTCSAGQLCCNATCVDPQTSSSHCGSCDISCTRGESCSGGMCGCGAAHCVGNETCCADGCFDLQQSSVHCGSSCSAPGCPAGYACMNGNCQQTTCIPACANGNTCVGTSCMCGNLSQCPSTQNCCTGGCFNLQTDHDHCHNCTHACGLHEQCVAGVCKKNLGFSCSTPGDCVSNHCADGVCCDKDCNNACKSCALIGMKGTCSPVQQGMDPHGQCAANPQSKCGTNGQCANGTCAFWPAGIPCQGQSDSKCTDEVTLAGWFCDGKDVCMQASVDCHPYKCVMAGGPFGDECASGACASALMGKTMCTAFFDVCAPDSTCCIPLIDDCANTYCDRFCPF